MDNQIFRAKAMEKLSSPEQLDQLLEITSPKSWLALLTVAGILLAILIWSVTGSIPVRVQGQGILMSTEGVFSVAALAAGQITDIQVTAGSFLTKNQVLASIVQQELLEQIREAEAVLAEKRKDYDETLEKGMKEETKLKLAAARKQKETISDTIESSKKQLGWLEEKIASQKELLKQGLITKQTLLATEHNLDQQKETIKQNESELKRVSAQEIELEKSTPDELKDRKRSREESEKRLKQLEDRLKLTAKVYSPYAGRVLELKVADGDLVNRGTQILSLEPIGGETGALKAVLYIPSSEGKKLSPGMEVHISPTTVKREEYGVMLGKITYVAEFPATRQGMMRILNNESLVQVLAGNMPPIEVYAELLPDNMTKSGFRWSSSSGPPDRVYSGTLCGADIITSRRKPVYFVIPYIRKKSGI